MCEVLSRRKYKNSIVVVLKIAETRTESELVISAKLVFYFDSHIQFKLKK